LVKRGRVDDDTLYFIYSSSDSDSGKIYLGTRLIGGADNNAALMFNAGPVLEIETDLSGNVTYSHKKIAAPTEEKESFNINKYLTGIKTDSYGHIISFNTANLDLNKYATNEEAKSNGGVRYIN
jgi:hypothetical protein